MKMTYDTEQEENDHNETPNAAGDRAPEDATGRCDAGVLRFLGDVTRSIKSYENSCRGKVRKAPVPACGSSGSVVGRHEGIVCGSEPVYALARCYWQPDHIQGKVNEDECGRQIEYPFEVSG